MKISQLIRRLLSIPPGSVIRAMKLRITGREYLISGKCLCCGKCCTNINLKYQGGWIRNKSQFHQLLKENPHYDRFRLVHQKGKYLQFDCTWYSDDSGCKDYQNRLDICRKYPSKSLLMHGGCLLDDCGYSITEGIPFKKYLEKQMKKNPKG